jgi:hypothetical protein
MNFNPTVISSDGLSASHGSSSTEQKAPVVDSRDKKLSHLTEVAFAPFGSGDVFDQCMGINIARNKPPVPIVPVNHQAQASLNQSKLERIKDYTQEKESATKTVADANATLAIIAEQEQKLSGIVPKSDAQAQKMQGIVQALATQKDVHTRALQNATVNVERWNKFLSAAKSTEILSPEEKLSDLPDKATVYLPGHGNANYHYLQTTPEGGEIKHMKEVAKDLKDAGLPKDARVKMKACHSADTEKRSTFVVDPPSSEGGEDGDKVAPAKVLADALDQPVIGYQGEGKTNGRHEGGHNLRADGSSNLRRASEVRKTFSPDPSNQ